MLPADEKILFTTAIATTVLMVCLIAVVIIAITKYQNRKRKHLIEVHNLRNIYQQEILKAQLEMQEQTFRTISQEIHDNIGQILSLIRLNLSSIKAEEDSASRRKIISSKELLDKAIKDLRDLSKRLNTEYVSQQSLAELLKFQLTLLQRTELYGTAFEVHGEERQLDPEKKIIVFRIAQEALNNIIKHADAKNISVLLMYLPGKIILSIKDDGRGFDAAALFNQAEPVRGIGTRNMYHRARLVGAEFSLQSKPGESCLAQLIIPTN